MKDYGRVQGTVAPESLKIDEYSVWLNTNVKEVETKTSKATNGIWFNILKMSISKFFPMQMMS